MEMNLINFYNDKEIKQILIKKIKNSIAKDYCKSYSDVLYIFIETIQEINYDEKLEKEECIKSLELGDYQGDLCLMYKINDDNIYVTNTRYGSCSGCDTLQAILHTLNEEEQLKELLTLILHLIQKTIKII